jgi:UDP-N-acetylmuramate dehydrogenase
MMATQTELDALAAEVFAVPGTSIERQVPAARFCTYRVGGPLDVLVHVATADAAEQVATVVARAALPVLCVGNGSNLLVSDRGFAGVAIPLGGDLATVAVDGTRVCAGGAALLPRVARTTVAAGLTGFEWAVGVPGSVGGAVRMNAGGHGSDMAASVQSADVVDFATGIRQERLPETLAFGYRTSAVASTEVVLRASLQLQPGDTAAGEEQLRDIVGWRRTHQPGGANAGSVFTNPEGDSAGRLIDAAGGKGLRVGSAEVSTKHANFIQADDGGSADDIVALMARIVDLVNHEHDITLHAETRLIGFDDSAVAHVQSGQG